MNLLSFGSVNKDIVYHVDHIVREKETISCRNMTMGIGGKGLNQSIALSRAAGSACLAARVCEKDGELLVFLHAQNVDTRFVEICPERTGHAIIQVDQNGQNSIIVAPGANAGFTPEYVGRVFDEFRNGAVVLQNEINLIPEILKKAHEAGNLVLFNPSPFSDAILREYPLELVDIFVVNEVEGGAMTGEREPEKILRAMLEAYPSSKTVLTLGAEGSYFADRRGTIYQSAFPAEVADTTAAGDTFLGYFLSSYTKTSDPKEALRLASRAAAIAVSRPGAAASIPFFEELA
ncbi:MAG TPA: ribokinase [Oscillospiraceae bacterium]|nr:ribokinase [Oscillospiraceae bacterium]